MTGSIQKDIYAEMAQRWIAYAHGTKKTDDAKEFDIIASVDKHFIFGHFYMTGYLFELSLPIHSSLWFRSVDRALDYWRDIVTKKGLKVDKEPTR